MKINMHLLNGTNKMETRHLVGELKGIVVSFENVSVVSKTSITIKSELGYTLLSCRDFWDTEYIALKTRVKTNNEKLNSLQLADQYESFFLDEKLIIEVNGKKDQEVGIILKVV